MTNKEKEEVKKAIRYLSDENDREGFQKGIDILLNMVGERGFKDKMKGAKEIRIDKLNQKGDNNEQ